jgi:hypothetical protein
MLVACLALFVALGGTGIAATHYLITKASQIKPSVIAQLRGHNGSPGQNGANGVNGVPGPPGARGAPGPAGPVNLSEATVIEGPEVEVPPGEVESAIAFCPGGQRAISGGGFGSVSGLNVSETGGGREGWFVITVNTTAIPETIHAEAVCAGAGSAVAARAHSHARISRLMHRALKAARLVRGPRGPAGAQGPEGKPGPGGAKGATGPPGDVIYSYQAPPSWATGATGAEGPRGPEGPAGLTADYRACGFWNNTEPPTALGTGRFYYRTGNVVQYEGVPWVWEGENVTNTVPGSLGWSPASNTGVNPLLGNPGSPGCHT